MKPASEILDLPATAPTSRAEVPSRAVDFYELTKPRMNFLVVITTMVGFLLASRGPTNWRLLLGTILGTALCAACAAVLNQIIERDLDAKMPRTRNRPIPTGRITVREATILGIAFGIAGVAYLALAVNLLTAALGLITIGWYLLLYTPAKRFTTLNTVIGAVPGAIPPMMGFAAVQNSITPAAIALFGILFFWQMPHFLAIAILYRRDYQLGGFKMLPCVEDDAMPITGRMMVLYSLALIPMSLLPAELGVAGATYFTAAVLLGLAFLSFAISCATSAAQNRTDARKLFFASIIYLPLLLAAMMFDKL